MTLQCALRGRELTGNPQSNLISLAQQQWYTHFAHVPHQLNRRLRHAEEDHRFAYISDIQTSPDGALTCISSTENIIEIHEPGASFLQQDTLRLRLTTGTGTTSRKSDHILWGGRDGKDEILVGGDHPRVCGFDLRSASANKWKPTYTWKFDPSFASSAFGGGVGRGSYNYVHGLTSLKDCDRNGFLACFAPGLIARYDWRAPKAVDHLKLHNGSLKTAMKMVAHENCVLSAAGGAIQVHDLRKGGWPILRRDLEKGFCNQGFTVFEKLGGTASRCLFGSEQGNIGCINLATNWKVHTFPSSSSYFPSSSCTSSSAPASVMRGAGKGDGMDDGIEESSDYRMLTSNEDTHSYSWYVRRKRGVVLPLPFGSGWKVLAPSVKTQGFDITFIPASDLSQHKEVPLRKITIPSEREVVAVDACQSRTSVIVGTTGNYVDVYDEAHTRTKSKKRKRTNF